MQEDYEKSNACNEELVRIGDNELNEVQEPNRMSNPSRLASSASQKRKKTKIISYFMPRTTPGAHLTLKSVLQSKEIMEKCDIVISK